MGKTLHIIPSGSIWPRIVGKWIGEGPDKSDHEVTQYPVPTNIHYLPEDLTDVEMMKTVISWHKPNSYQAGDLYRDLINIIETVNEGLEYDEVFVWHAEDADSQFEDVKGYTDRNVDIDSITRDSFEVGTANIILPSFGCATNFLCNHETRNYKNA